MSRAVKPAMPCIHSQDCLPRSLLCVDGKYVWNSPQELKAVLGLQDLEDRRHHIPVVAVPYRQSCRMIISAQIIDKVTRAPTTRPVTRFEKNTDASGGWVFV